MMEVYQQNEAWADKDGDLVFHHTKFILKDGDQYYYARDSRRQRHISEADLSELKLIPIPVSTIWPVFPTHFTRVPEPLPQNCHIKRHDLFHYGDIKSPTEMGTVLLNEAEVCEILGASPHHPHIAQYLGCLVENGKLMGVCYVKYDVDLGERVTKNTRPFDVDLILQGIQDGIQYLHSLGLIHCDINPRNILMNGEIPVIGDFDSCRREGKELGIKAGTEGWTRKDFKFANPENDYYGLSKIRDFLLENCKDQGG